MGRRAAAVSPKKVTVAPSTEFANLHEQDFLMNVLLRDVPERQKDLSFAVGPERGSLTIESISLDILFLGGDNRIAGILEQRHAANEESAYWGALTGGDLDERLSQTTRNIMIVDLQHSVTRGGQAMEAEAHHGH